ncbi:MAG: glycosyltransferase family 4 protein [Dysgonamonadaceae bacterium]|nr:glycosyltransferase family 4 protein [Dysgonamonadaceae bacterium]
MIYLLVFVLLFIFELLYFRIANKHNIIDMPNERSSHTKITLRGGGVIYWIAAMLYFATNYSVPCVWFVTGITLIAAVSFVDDMVSVSRLLRLFVHLLAMTCAFVLANVFNIYPWWAIVIGYIVFTGIVNAYNFMDGINGITGFYSIAVLASLQYVNMYVTPFVSPDLIWYPIIASIVFLFFNFRKRARCFAGDVGSISIAFWVVTLLLLLIIETNNLVWLGFLMVYGVDSVCTILHRLYLKQNIMDAHRMHFYQVLANERKRPHRVVAVIYFVVQLIASGLIIFLFPIYGWWVFVVLLVGMMGGYLVKFKLKDR